MPTTILLTGANGFLGSHIARELLNRRYVVRALVRPGSNRKTLPELPIEIVEGNLLNPDDVLRAAKGCKAVIHAAALAQVNPAQDSAVWDVNKTGTENVLQAVEKTNMARMVYVGTANVFGFGTKEQPGTERSPYSGAAYGVDYMDSKVAATELVKQAAHRHEVPAIMVHPTFLLGPLDGKPTSGAMLLAVAQKQLPGYPMGGKNVVHVRDAAIATVNALTMGRLGESYIVGNENLTYCDLFGLMADVANVSSPRFAVPPSVAIFYARVSEWLANIRGRVPAVNVPMAMIANDGHYFSSEKAVRELNLPQTPIREAIQEAYDWFSINGYLR
jgi:dihydroflavonol-4-reductase